MRTSSTALPEHTATMVPSAGGAVARTWETPAGWPQVRAWWARLSQVVGARRAEQPDDICAPDRFATEVPFVSERWPANE